MQARARGCWRQLRATLRRRLGVSQASGRDVDLEQAVLRVGIAGAILLYAAYVAATGTTVTLGLRLALFAATCAMAAGFFMVWRFRKSSNRPASMRYFGICADLIPLTIGLWGADEPGVPVIGVYLWVTVGNGFRFGPKYLLASYWLSGICFTLLLLMVPFWQNHRGVGIGFGLVLATIPLYVLVLLSR